VVRSRTTPSPNHPRWTANPRLAHRRLSIRGPSTYTPSNRALATPRQINRRVAGRSRLPRVRGRLRVLLAVWWRLRVLVRLRGLA
jgi:hypothetical protein